MVVFDVAIRTPRLTLRPFVSSDLDDLCRLQSDPEVARYLSRDVHTRDQVRTALDRRLGMTRLAQDGDGLMIAVERDGRVIGELSLWSRSVQHRQGEVGFAFHPEVQGRGYATEAVTALLDFGFSRVAMHRVYGRTDARNAASIALMRRLRMRQEAHLRHLRIVDAEWADELTFAILDDEWRLDGARRSRRA